MVVVKSGLVQSGITLIVIYVIYKVARFAINSLFSPIYSNRVNDRIEQEALENRIHQDTSSKEKNASEDTKNTISDLTKSLSA
jgi:hypothetical protein